MGTQAKRENRKSAKSPGLGVKSKGGSVVSPYFEHNSETEIKKDLEKEEGKSKVNENKKFKKEQSLAVSKSAKRKVKTKGKTKDSEFDKEMKISGKVNTSGRSVRRQRKPINYMETSTEKNEDDVNRDEDSDVEDDYDGLGDNDDGNDYSDDDDFIETPKRSLSSKLSHKFKQESDKRSRKSCMPSVERGYARKLVKTIDDDAKFEKSSKPVKRRRSLNDIRHSPTVQMISSDSESSHDKDPLQEEIEPSSRTLFCTCHLQLQLSTLINANGSFIIN